MEDVYKSIEVRQLDDEEVTALYACLQILEESLLDDEHKARIAYYLHDRYRGG